MYMDGMLLSDDFLHKKQGILKIKTPFLMGISVFKTLNPKPNLFFSFFPMIPNISTKYHRKKTFFFPYALSRITPLERGIHLKQALVLIMSHFKGITLLITHLNKYPSAFGEHLILVNILLKKWINIPLIPYK